MSTDQKKSTHTEDPEPMGSEHGQFVPGCPTKQSKEDNNKMDDQKTQSDDKVALDIAFENESDDDQMTYDETGDDKSSTSDPNDMSKRINAKNMVTNLKGVVTNVSHLLSPITKNSLNATTTNAGSPQYKTLSDCALQIETIVKEYSVRNFTNTININLNCDQIEPLVGEYDQLATDWKTKKWISISNGKLLTVFFKSPEYKEDDINRPDHPVNVIKTMVEKIIKLHDYIKLNQVNNDNRSAGNTTKKPTKDKEPTKQIKPAESTTPPQTTWGNDNNKLRQHNNQPPPRSVNPKSPTRIKDQAFHISATKANKKNPSGRQFYTARTIFHLLPTQKRAIHNLFAALPQLNPKNAKSLHNQTTYQLLNTLPKPIAQVLLTLSRDWKSNGGPLEKLISESTDQLKTSTVEQTKLKEQIKAILLKLLTPNQTNGDKSFSPISNFGYRMLINWLFVQYVLEKGADTWKYFRFVFKLDKTKQKEGKRLNNQTSMIKNKLEEQVKLLTGGDTKNPLSSLAGGLAITLNRLIPAIVHEYYGGDVVIKTMDQATFHDVMARFFIDAESADDDKKLLRYNKQQTKTNLDNIKTALTGDTTDDANAFIQQLRQNPKITSIVDGIKSKLGKNAKKPTELKEPNQNDHQTQPQPNADDTYNMGSMLNALNQLDDEPSNNAFEQMDDKPSNDPKQTTTTTTTTTNYKDKTNQLNIVKQHTTTTIAAVGTKQ